MGRQAGGWWVGGCTPSHVGSCCAPQPGMAADRHGASRQAAELNQCNAEQSAMRSNVGCLRFATHMAQQATSWPCNFRPPAGPDRMALCPEKSRTLVRPPSDCNGSRAEGQVRCWWQWAGQQVHACGREHSSRSGSQSQTHTSVNTSIPQYRPPHAQCPSSSISPA